MVKLLKKKQRKKSRTETPRLLEVPAVVLATKLEGESEESSERDESAAKSGDSKWKKFWPGAKA